ncbi:hypothetical protein ACTQ49_07890 [Luteococcus sp. Sow4_B9]|uniref:hypothetical protein n=1 Tax=Luteococcus sp. Sow4_B9 TaxID=3438792 RepID=UPI003F9A40D2
MDDMPLFSRKPTSKDEPARRPDPAVLASYRDQTGDRRTPLAQASGPRIDLLGFTDLFAVRYAAQDWQMIGWHQVRSGGWKAEREELHWRLLDGSAGAFHLTSMGAFPGLFRERVQASIVVEDRFEVPTGGMVLLAARRDLGQAQPTLEWTVDAVRGASLDDPEVKDLADRALARLRADYDF